MPVKLPPSGLINGSLPNANKPIKKETAIKIVIAIKLSVIATASLIVSNLRLGTGAASK
ncbi:unannotated protein [freshwater metagenome]|uniref:Unannotated protein n=1 Tax=freshwater metagenome TaxID=449393 RepID=A0A6J6EIR8_9ZZZZ